jgi:hypothetical protein
MILTQLMSVASLAHEWHSPIEAVLRLFRRRSTGTNRQRGVTQNRSRKSAPQSDTGDGHRTARRFVFREGTIAPIIAESRAHRSGPVTP